MYKALIVDDEIYAVMGIRSGIDWQVLQITEVYEAYNMRDALKVFDCTSIDIMICDIEMPKGTGIELLERVNEISSGTETIFLTAHSVFNFMKRAIQLDGFDYLLKPIEFDVLQETISKAIEAIEHERKIDQLREQYKPYYDNWLRKKDLIAEKFWNDILSGRLVCNSDNVKQVLEEHELSSLQNTLCLPILVSVESWTRDFSTKDEEMMEYAVRKGASEMLLRNGNGKVIQTKQGVNVVILYEYGGELIEHAELHRCCEEYKELCKNYFSCNVSCYIGDESTIYDIASIYKKLLELEYKNHPNSTLTRTYSQAVVPFDDGIHLQMQHTVIRQVQEYIKEHLNEPITRQQLAGYVHLNPAYLSRLFKRKMGESITDYILNVRMSFAKDLILSTDMSISDIAKKLGYFNFSYFSKMFRRVYQASPQQFRQKSVEVREGL